MIEKKIVFVDMDGVLADFQKALDDYKKHLIQMFKAT